MRPALVVAVGSAALAWTAAVLAQTGGVIPPGKEQLIVRMVGDAWRDRAPGDRFDARVDRDVIRLTLKTAGERDARVVVALPSARVDAEEELAPGVWMNCDEACAPEDVTRWRPLGQRLAQERDAVREQLWALPTSKPEPSRDAAPRGPPPQEEASGAVKPRAWLTWSVLALAILASLTLLSRSRERWAALARHWPAVAILAGFSVVAATVPNVMPLHEHNSFVARSDCAYDWSCDADPRAPGWSPPTFHAYGLLLRALPYRVATLGFVSLAWTVVSLGLLYAFVHRLAGEEDTAAGRRIASVTVAVLAASPAFIRVAVAGTFWPFAIACLLAAGLLCLHAVKRGGWLAPIGSAAWFAIALGSNLVFLALIPLLVIAPLCWSAGGRKLAPAAVVAVLGSLAFAVPDVAAALRAVFVDRAGVFGEHDGAGAFFALLGNLRFYFADPTITPAPFVVLAVCGLLALRGRWRRYAPVLYGLAAIQPVLSRWGGADPLNLSYPVSFINQFPSYYFLAIGAGLGVEWLRGLVAQRFRARLTAALAAASLGFVPLCEVGLDLLTGERVLERELRALSRAFEELPEHDVLVVPPVIQRPIGDLPTDGDPIEAFFPIGEYRYVLARRGMPKTTVLQSTDFHPEGSTARTLLYVGSTFLSFGPTEIRAGVVGDGERPELARLRRELALEPALTFPIATEQHPAISMRLDADRSATAELGFYWMRPAPSHNRR